MSEMKCPNCGAALQRHEVAVGWCASCGNQITFDGLEAQNGQPVEAASQDPQLDVGTPLDGSTVCLLCQENSATEICYLRLIRVELQFQTKITRWTDIRGRCCERCRRKIAFWNRTEGIRIWLRILLMGGLFVGYVCLIPLLLRMGVPGALVGFGCLLPVLVAATLWRLMASQRWQSLLSPQTIEHFRAMGIYWDANQMSGLSITREPVPGSSHVEMTEQ